MKTLLVYSSKRGTTEKIMFCIKTKLKGDITVINVAKKPFPELNGYDRIVIGGSIYAGSLNPKLKNFISYHHNELLKKEIALFLVCMYDGEKAKKQFEENYPEELREKAFAHGYFGGEIILSNLNLFERLIVWKVETVKHDVRKINKEGIADFVKELNKK